MHYAAEVSYDGSDFCGWQKQPGLPTVQESIEAALTKLNSQEHVSIVGAGRTDAGVHAKGQVCSFAMKRNRDPRRLLLALNANLHENISAIRIVRVTSDFNALLNANAREYKYFIWNSNTIYPHIKPVTCWLKSLDYNWEMASEACKYFEGEHNFKSFCKIHRCPDKPIRTLYKVRLEKRGKLITLSVKGDGFLTNMVRIMMGCLEKVAKGEHRPEWVKELLTSEYKRSTVGRTFSPEGLFLWKVNYDESIWNSY